QMPRGPLYATYTFLEDYVGVCWWTPEERHLPSKTSLAVDAKDHEYAPKIIVRETFYKGAHNPKFAPYMKSNGHFNRIPEAFGGHRSIIGWCHTFYQFLPPKDYFEAHPEWYSEINGKRQNGHFQLCLTNEEMRKEFTKVVLYRIRKDPTAGMISISQNDWHGRCTCAKCKAVEEEEGSPSGLLVRFVNAVAADVAKEYPDFLLETLAYQYTRKAPKITRPAKNVVIRLCSIEMNFAQPLETGPDNVSFRKDIEDWSAIAPNLFIWNYVTNFGNYILPQPNWRGLAPDIRFFVRHNAIGLFEQGDAGCSVGDFVRPRQWMIAHLQWNPDLDERALMKKFFDGYYGPAGKHLMDYIDFLCDAVEKAKYNLRCGNDTVSGWLSQEQLAEAAKIYAAAEEAVKGDEVLAKRVRRERLQLDLAQLMGAAEFGKAKRFLKTKDYRIPQNIFQIADEFAEMVKNAGQYREGTPMGNYGESIRDRVRTALGVEEYVPESCKDRQPDSWDAFPVSNFRIFGNLAKQVDDPEAVLKKAARMPNTHYEWGVQIQVPVNLYNPEKNWKVVARVRCDAAADNGKAMNFGVYGQGVFLWNESVDVAKCNGTKYVTIESKPFSIKPLLGKPTVIWFAPVQRPPEEVKAIYIDEVLLLQAD
ncbi:MAG: DUF4838 domain-containing protein, partial [Victivallales bacterium]|nr:DUF4838 domain-containing protein [Victivallales bacterium]